MRIVYICPYFGKLPNFFDLWLKSCEYNPDIDWIIMTDDKRNFNYPNNVKVIYTSFNDIKQIIQSKFDFKISLETPYKLCDFKPTYGYVFSDIIKGYDFWGHCDLDCIFGNIREFITDEILKKYEKILSLGHMTLYKNTENVNNRFNLRVKNKITYKEVLSSQSNYAFDEWSHYIGMNDIYYEYQIPFFKGDIYADISCLKYNFQLSKYNSEGEHYYETEYSQIFIWESGRLYRVYLKDDVMIEEDYAYVHFQKRKMDISIENIVNYDSFMIVPNQFRVKESILETRDIKYYSKKKLIYSVYFKQRYKNLKLKIKYFIGR